MNRFEQNQREPWNLPDTADGGEGRETIGGMAAFDEKALPVAQRIGVLVKRAARLSRLTRLTQNLNVFDARGVVRDAKAVLQELAAEVANLELVLKTTDLAPDSKQEEIWSQQFEQALKALNIEARGPYPTYLVFPFEVKVDLKNQAAIVNNRTVRVLRPVDLAKLVQDQRDRLYRAPFNDRRFAGALILIYDVLQQHEGDLTRSISLQRAYELLSLRTGPAGYTKLEFAFDLYRLRHTSEGAVGNRRIVLNPTRRATHTFAVPDPQGHVENLGSYEVVTTGP